MAPASMDTRFQEMYSDIVMWRSFSVLLCQSFVGEGVNLLSLASLVIPGP